MSMEGKESRILAKNFRKFLQILLFAGAHQRRRFLVWMLGFGMIPSFLLAKRL